MADDTTTTQPKGTNSHYRPHRGSRGHKGRGAALRHQESYRYKKNVETVNAVRADIRARFTLPEGSPYAAVGSQARNFLQPRVPTSIQKPARFFPIRTDGVRPLFQSVRSTLINMKIEVLDEEFQALIYVTARQISAKLFFSQIGFGVSAMWRMPFFELFRETSKILSECLRPLAIYIECIGRFSLHGQTNVPMLCSGSDDTYDPIGMWIGNHVVENYDGVTDEVLAQLSTIVHCVDPMLYDDEGRLQMPALSHSMMIHHYKNLISKVVRRNADAVVVMDLEKGIGSSVQLVGCVDEGVERRAGCVYPLELSELTMGALFGFGLRSRLDLNGYPHPLHNLELSCVQCDVPTPGWMHEFALSMYKT